MKGIISSKWLNIVLFNLLWLGCVAGRYSLLWLTASIVLLYLLALWLNRSVTVAQVLLPALLGITVDFMLTMAGVFNFGSHIWPVPLWLMVLWLAFVSTLPLSLCFLDKRKGLTVLAGATGFPFSYAMGERLGAVTFGVGYFEALVFLSLIWAAGLPLLFYLNRRISTVSHAVH